MKLKRRFVTAFLAGTMALSLAACGGGDSGPVNTGTNAGTGTRDNSASTPGDLSVFDNGFIVGHTTDLNGDFLDGWTNGSQNKAVKNLINGYGTYELSADQTYQLNDVAIESLDITEADNGDKTYTFKLAEDLTWSNGEGITAQDYLFAVMLNASPEFGELDSADNTGFSELVGVDAFHAGETKTFSGLNLLGDYEFSMTIKGEELPNFYEPNLVAVQPLPMAVIAPGATITDEGQGATLSEDFTADLIRDNILDPNTGYRYNPQVTSGPYNFVSFDAGSLQCTLELNPEFKGRGQDGATGTIEKLVLKSVIAATEIDELNAGTVHLLPGISGGETINAGLDVVDSGKADYASYARSGYGKLEFACEFGPTQFTEVRQALAYCLDRVEFANIWTAGYGTLPHGWYGMSQWEYDANRSRLETELNPYNFSVDDAEAVLVEGGWVFNADGSDYVDGSAGLRHKDVDGELMPLVIEWASSVDNPVADLLASMLPEAATQAGIQINQTPMDFGLLLDHLYRTSDGMDKYHMFNLATGFADTLPTWYYCSPEYYGLYNTERINDEELLAIANDMKATDPTDTEGWADKWFDYQVRYNELVVNLPLYSDEYHEFFAASLKNYDPVGLWSWEHAILRADLA